MKKVLFLASLFVSTLVSAQVYPLNENFDAVSTSGSPATGPLPSGWTTTSGFKVYAGHCSSAPNGCSTEMDNSHTKDTLNMPLIGPLTANTKISLQYRFVNAASYPATGYQLGTGDQVTIDAFALGMWQNSIATLNNVTNPTPLTTWTTYTYTSSLIAALAGQSIQLRIDVSRATANSDWFLDIDNVIVADNIMGISYNALNPPSLLVFPNPTQGDFTLWLKNYQANTSVEVNIYNFLGQKVKAIRLDQAYNNRVLVNTNGLEKGMYVVEVRSGKEVATSKIQID